MQPFPELKDNQVALLRAELKTGHVVDENFNLAISDTQEVYTIFDDVETAVAFVKKTSEINKEFEFVIYGKDKSVINYIANQ